MILLKTLVAYFFTGCYIRKAIVDKIVEKFFFLVENIFIQSRIFLYSSDYFFTVENFFFTVKIIFCSREFFYSRDYFLQSRIFFYSREHFYTQEYFLQSRIFTPQIFPRLVSNLTEQHGVGKRRF
jgi:hypothetical protein